MNNESLIRRGHSSSADARTAARELFASINQPDAGLIVFFCSSLYEQPTLAEELSQLFGAVPLIGCTTAGEIGPAGYRSQSLVGVSFSREVVTVAVGAIGNLAGFEIGSGHQFAKDLLRELESRSPQVSLDNTFAFLLIDGLSVREEPVVRAMQTGLGGMPLIGGSAGDDLRFSQTCVFHNGAFHTDSAVLALVSTPLPFVAFKTQHFVSEGERLVVTEADVANRIVKEINGLPAAEEYARVINSAVDQLSPAHFAAAPVVVHIDGADYVRSIQSANADGSLTFFCAIDEGLVLRVARGRDLLGNLERMLTEVRRTIGSPQLIFGCDCILRNLEMGQSGLLEAVGQLLEANNTVGFSTYGEQYGGVHVNQTFTGIAIGEMHE